MKKNIIILTLILIGTFSLCKVSAQEAYSVGDILSFNFDTDTLNSAPAGMTSSSNKIQVVNFEGKNVLRMQAEPSQYVASNINVSNTVSTNTVTTVTADNIIELSADFYFPQVLTNDRQANILLQSNASSARWGAPIRFLNDKIVAGLGDNQIEVRSSYPVGQWFTIKTYLVISPGGRAQSFFKSDIIINGVSESLYQAKLTDYNLSNSNFPNTGISFFQIALSTKDTQTDTSETVMFYVDNIDFNKLTQTTALDLSFDDGFYMSGTAPTVAGITRSTSSANISVANRDDGHGNVLKFGNVGNEFISNTNSLSASINGNTWIYEQDMFFASALSGNKTSFLQFFAAEGTGSGYRFIPYAFYNGTITYKLDGTGQIKSSYPINEWFKMRVIYNYTGASYADHTVILQLVYNDGTTEELYNKKRSELSLTQNDSGFPGPTGVATVRNFNSSEEAYLDNIKFYNVKTPVVSDVTLTGKPVIGETITVGYTFTDPGEKNNASTVQWYRGSTVSSGLLSEKTLIEGQTGLTYNVTEQDEGRFLICEVLAKNDEGVNAYVPVREEIAIMPFIYYTGDRQNYDENVFSMVNTDDKITVSNEEIGGRGAIKFAPIAGQIGRMVSVQNVNYFTNLTSDEIIYQNDYYIPQVLSEGSVLLTQFFTSSSSIAGRYFDAVMLKGNGIYDNSGNLLETAPLGEWFTVKTVISMRENKPYYSIIYKDEETEKIIKEYSSMPLNEMNSIGLMMFRVSYTVADDANECVYLDGYSLDNKPEASIYNRNVQEINGDLCFTGKVIDYTLRKKIAIFAVYNSNGNMIKVQTAQLNPLTPEEVISITIENMNLQAGDYTKVLVWDGFEQIRPIF